MQSRYPDFIKERVMPHRVTPCLAPCDEIPAICDRINGLPMAETLQVKCDYKNLKSPSALKFASLEYDEWEDYEPKDMEKVIFKKNKATADAFAEELDKQLYLAQNQL